MQPIKAGITQPESQRRGQRQASEKHILSLRCYIFWNVPIPILATNLKVTKSPWVIPNGPLTLRTGPNGEKVTHLLDFSSLGARYVCRLKDLLCHHLLLWGRQIQSVLINNMGPKFIFECENISANLPSRPTTFSNIPSASSEKAAQSPNPK